MLNQLRESFQLDPQGILFIAGIIIGAISIYLTKNSRPIGKIFRIIAITLITVVIVLYIPFILMVIGSMFFW